MPRSAFSSLRRRRAGATATNRCARCATTPGVRRLTASVTAGNEASKQLLLKAGFRLEGELRENYWLNGRWHNDWLFGRLRGEGDAP
ncbi:hypothetical protein BN1200_70006 [Klebsiella variicola]|nr:hypothetical protein BN1200_70006 [Klebsiella variicola]